MRVCVFIKLHITAQSGPVILVNDTCYENRVVVVNRVCVVIPFLLDVRLVDVYQPGSHRRKVTMFSSSFFLLLCLPQLNFIAIPFSTVKSNFV